MFLPPHIPGLGKSPGEGNGYPFQYSGPESSMDRGAWQVIVHGVAESGTHWATLTFSTYPEWFTLLLFFKFYHMLYLYKHYV